jgi:hypothetical protein
MLAAFARHATLCCACRTLIIARYAATAVATAALQTFAWCADGTVHVLGMTADTLEMMPQPVEVFGLHQAGSG